MIIYDIPKEYRQSTKLDLSYNFIRVQSVIYYLSVRKRSDNTEIDSFCMNRAAVIDVQKMKESYPDDITVSVIFDTRYSITIDYAVYDVLKFKGTSFISEVI